MEQRSPRLRWLVVWVLAVVWMATVLGRLTYLQLFCYSEYFAKAQRQQQRTFEISPKRGPIYDRKGRELAVSIPMDSCFGDPGEIKDAAMVARLLGPILNLPAEDLEAKIRDAKTPVRLARKVPPETVQRVQDMNLRGVFFQKEYRRVYPQHELAAHTLGYVNVDEKGLGGIELSLDSLIRGKPGRMMVMADGRRRRYDRSEAAADPGASVVLTIDQTIQFIAEKELSRAIAETHAKNGSVVVQDPNNGHLFALANWPTFDPNDAGKFSVDVRMNRAVAAAYEPGSTFKMITLAGALENGVTNPREFVDCQMGSILVAGRLIHDHKPFGVLSVRDVLTQSSDVGTIKIALRLGAPNLYEKIRAFGIGQLTGIELPGENRGLFRPLENWTASSIGSIAIGQEVSVTPVQIVSAVSAIANGGTLHRPRLVEDIHGGRSSAQRSGSEPQQVIDAKTAATLRDMMESVILEGTGKPAKLDGYTAAGKSGTAQKIDPATGRYSPNQYVASFVGFAPVNTPVVTILVVLDSPVGLHYGGDVGGPVFKRISEQVLAYLEVSHDVPAASRIETVRNQHATPESAPNSDANRARFQAAVAKQPSEFASAPTVGFGDEGAVVVPDFSGQGLRRVMEACTRLGLVPSPIGSGVAVEQFPEAGARVQRGIRVTVRFGRAGEIVPASLRGDGN
jgi:cell division protein FtsI (penicillin-binding protein 3)